MGKKLSFVIPAYNEEKNIAKCLDSILSRGIEDIEILLIDDGSTDSTLRIMRAYENRYKFISVYHVEENLGPSHARNIGIEGATGSYLWFLDADDYLIGNPIAELSTRIIEDPLDCFFFYYQIERDGIFSDCAPKAELIDHIEDRVYTGQELFRIKTCYLPKIPDKMSFIISRDFVERMRLRFVEGVVGEDGMFQIHIYLCANRVKQLEQSFFVYHNNQDSIGHRYEKTYEFACCFVKFVYLLRIGFEKVHDNEMRQAYAKNLRAVYEQIQLLYSRLDSDCNPIKLLKEMDEDAAEVFYCMYGNNWENEFSLIEDKIKKADDILIYGAKQKAKRLAAFLDGHNKRIRSYVVSDEVYGEKDKKNPLFVFGIPVIPLSELCNVSKNTLVIVTVREVFRKQVIGSLNELNIYNIVCV